MKMAIEQVSVSVKALKLEAGCGGECRGATQEIGGISRDLKMYLYGGTVNNN